MDQQITIGAEAGTPVNQLGSMSNRHGLIAGATGTGKTVTLQVLAEGYARMGVPVFVTDIKGDLSGIAAAGKPHKEIDRRLGLIPLPSYEQRGVPTLFWDLLATPGRKTGQTGHPLRTTISEMGPLILGNLLDLNDTQGGVLYAAFAIADDDGMLLLDLKDLRAMLTWMADNAKALRSTYGNISSASVGAIQRRLLVLEEQGGDLFFGEPAVRVRDLMQKDFSGTGVVNLLDASVLTRESPKLYAAFLMWLLSELFEELPEAGDSDQPVLVLFFDEAHLMFKDMPKALLEKVEQVVRLIRSKGVGVYFVTQNPSDIPDGVAGQLGLKIQHALRAFTPRDQKALKSVAQGFRTRAGMDTAKVITELETGEALVSVLGPKGAPQVPRRTLIRPPESRIGAVSKAKRAELLANSPMHGRYDTRIDRESAYELLQQRAEHNAKLEVEREQQERKEQEEAKANAKKGRRGAGSSGGRKRQGIGEAMLKSAARAVGRSLGSKLVRGLLGSLLK